METKSWTTVDKREWERGPWDDEPDKMQWEDETTGLPCLIVRGPSGALCGYVGVPEGHPWYQVEYDNLESWPDVHGGLTFSGECADSSDESRHICHVPGEGEPDHVWWLGFDCAHGGDLSPAHSKYYSSSVGESYKGIGYVRSEVTHLAAQCRKRQPNLRERR